MEHVGSPSEGHLFPAVPYRWLPDGAADDCMRCGLSFQIWRRRHHCRVCGQIFCDACTQGRRRVPDILRDRLPEGGGDVDDPVRVCDTCAAHLDRCADRWVEIVRLNPFLDARDWRTLAVAGRVPRRASRVLLAAWRRIQYTLPWSTLAPSDVELLRRNLILLRGHARWSLLASRACLPVHLTEARSCPCEVLGCAADCGHQPRPGEAIETIHRSRFQLEAREYAIKALRAARTAALWPFAMPLIRLGCEDPTLVHMVLVDHACRDPAFAHHVVWRAWSLQEPAIADCILRCVGRSVAQSIGHSRRWAIALEGHVRSRGAPVPAAVAFPGDASLLVERVLYDQIGVVRGSASSPTVVPLLVQDLATGRRALRHVLYKPGDVRRDTAVMDCTRVMAAGEAAVPYGVVQLAQGGLILMVEGAQSLSNIRRTGYSLLNYLLENNGSTPAAAIRSRFVNSCAFATVLCLLVGVGDRHLDNILVRVSPPALFHIDFEYLFGEEPRHVVTSRPRLRITRQVEDALGGASSTDYSRFRAKCADYMRMAMGKSRELYYVLWGARATGDDALQAYLQSWLTPEPPDADSVKLRVDLEVRESTSRRTMDGVLDRMHDAAQGLSKIFR